MKKLKIFFNLRIRKTPWGGGNYFLANFVEFLKENGHKVIFELKKNIDIIFIIANSKELNPRIFKYKKKNPKTKIIHRINECDKRKNTKHIDQNIFKTNKIADETIFISNWLAEYFIEKGFDKPYEVIYNGCNPKHFYPEESKVLGDSIYLVTHHWSHNWMKGFDIYIKLDKILEENQDFTFNYIGRYYKDYNPKNTIITPPLVREDLGEQLRKYDIYVTASRWEPCGMHHIEGARCGLPVLYHREGGGINELCKNYGIEYYDIPTLLEGINRIKDKYQEYRNKIPYDFLSSKRCNEEFYKIIQRIEDL